MCRIVDCLTSRTHDCAVPSQNSSIDYERYRREHSRNLSELRDQVMHSGWPTWLPLAMCQLDDGR